MSSKQTLQKWYALPPEKQQEVADFVDFLWEKHRPTRPEREPLKGMWQGLNPSPITEEDIAEMRREVWAGFGREELL